MFNSKLWVSLVEKTYGYKSCILDSTTPEIYYSTVQNEIGEYLVTPPFGDFVCLTGNQLLALQPFVARNPELPIRLKVCSDDPPVVDGLFTEKDGYVHQINFESYEEWFTTLIKCKFRNQINQGHRRGLNVEVSREQNDIVQFWEMHANLRVNKFNEVPQPRKFFIDLHHIYFKADRGFLIKACDRESEVVAGIIVLVDGDTAYYKYAASRFSALTLRPNNFLLDRLIAYLDNYGLKKLNLGYTGDSSAYDGLRRYKISAGGVERIRYRMQTKSYDLLNVKQIDELNKNASIIISRGADLEEVNKFSEEYYRLLV